MNVVDATAIVGALAALVGIVLQSYWGRRKKRTEDNAESNVSWAGLNNAIGKERDHWKSEAMRMTAELDAQEATNTAAMAKLEQQYQADKAEWATKLAECQEKVRAIGYELYQLQKLLPPNLRPGPDLGGG